jgi:molybdate transport system substrate-binding protein
MAHHSRSRPLGSPGRPRSRGASLRSRPPGSPGRPRSRGASPRRSRPLGSLASGALCVLLLLAGCTSSAPRAASPAGSPSPSGALTIFAASPLRGAFDKVTAAFVTSHPGVQVPAPTYQGSQALATAILQGTPGDVFASADPADMNELTAAGFVVTGTAHTFARNALEIVVKAGDPKGIQSLADLGRQGVSVVLGDPSSVPAGRFGAQALAQAHVTVQPTSLEPSVTGILTKVQGGTADAGIVYRTDVVSAGSGVTGVAIPAAQNVVASYSIAVLKNPVNPAAAQAFVQFVMSSQGQAILQSSGLLPPTP